jgi:hypothetical protein
VKQLVHDITLLGLKRFVFKSDGEAAILALKAAVAAALPDCEVVPEEALVGHSQSNGEAEIANRAVSGTTRTMLDALRTNYGRDIPSKHPILKWLVQWSAQCLTRFQVSSDGKTAWQRERGRPWRRALPEFGESVEYIPIRASGGRQNKLEPHTKPGIFLGLRESNSELMIGTPGGVVRSSTVFRRPLSTRWDAAALASMQGVPWAPTPRGPVPALIGDDLPVIQGANSGTAAGREEDKAITPPSFHQQPRAYLPKTLYLRQSDFNRHGFSRDCRGCAVMEAGGTWRALHSEGCKQRMAALLSEEVEEVGRLQRSSQRQTDYFAEQLERDDAKRAKQHNHPTTTATTTTEVLNDASMGNAVAASREDDSEMLDQQQTNMQGTVAEPSELQPALTSEGGENSPAVFVDEAMVSAVWAKFVNMNLIESGPVNQQADDTGEFLYPDVYDQVTGRTLEPGLLAKARSEELGYIRKYGVYRKVPFEQAKARTGRPPIRTKWVDLDKGDAEHPAYRSRRVAMEVKKSWQATAFAGTPPLEALRFLCSLATSLSAENTEADPLCLSFLDITRAHFRAPATRELYVEIADEDQVAGEPRMCGELLMSMYGTQDAAQNWERHYTRFLVGLGFVAGMGSACLFVHTARGIRIDVHGDDFTSLGRENELLWLEAEFKKEFEVKTQGILGPKPHHSKSARVLGRLVTFTDQGLEYEADPRHAEIMVAECGLAFPGRAITPGVNRPLQEKASAKLTAADATAYRSISMRGQYLSTDRPDISFSTKELARSLQQPDEEDWRALERLCSYLSAHPRLVWHFDWQQQPEHFAMFTDSDDAGCLKTRSSTSSGHLVHGQHLLKHYSSTQKQLSLSSGESEFYATVKAASVGLGAVNMAEDLGFSLGCAIGSDASASISLTSRIGHGKTKHIHRNFLWIQQRVREGLITIFKVGTADNPSDLGTKHLSQQVMQHLLSLLNLHFATGHNTLALKAQLG